MKDISSRNNKPKQPIGSSDHHQFSPHLDALQSLMGPGESLGMPLIDGLPFDDGLQDFLGTTIEEALDIGDVVNRETKVQEQSSADRNPVLAEEQRDHSNPPTPVENESFVPASLAVDMSVHPSGIIPTLQNIVATVNLDCRLDLKHIALNARNAEYNPKRFAAVIMRIREPKTTALIFASGKMVITGAKSEELSRLAARKFARIIQKLGFPARFTDFRIQNIVGSCDIRFPIRLEGLAFSHSTYSSYEPELFPGLIYRMVRPKVVLLIFVSGKIVLTGARVREEIYQAFENIYPVLTEFRKP